MSLNDLLDYLGSVWYHSEPLELPHPTNKKLTSDALKFEPHRMCRCAFITNFWAIFYFILQNSHEKTFKMKYNRCLYSLMNMRQLHILFH